MYSGYITFGQGLLISLFSFLATFIILLVISYSISLMGSLVNKNSKAEKESSSTVVETPAKQVNEESEDENIPVVLAAISAYLNSYASKQKLTIRPLVRNDNKETAWSQAARFNNIKIR